MENILFVWDFHGVLEKDNEYAVQAICNQVIKEFGVNNSISIEKTRELYGLSWNEYYRHLAPNVTGNIIKTMCSRSIELSRPVSKKYIKPMDYAKEVLSTIKSKDHTNVLLTNTEPKRAAEFAESVGLKSFFDAIIEVYDISDNMDVVRRKSDALNKYLQNKKFSKVVNIGDKESDIKAGKSVGATTYLFTKAREKSDADYVITDLREILKEL
ncbi:MAG: HAD hydrolase-like protein [Candidatus Nanoarchaeia archaeon]|nr:HAD hydrolase-like protein [Candidatus Nanoarchaeia archaeon]MDD5239410.1 HAD hydrolase-like protein [Candidatus Nanoarchaeia archaeon]